MAGAKGKAIAVIEQFNGHLNDAFFIYADCMFIQKNIIRTVWPVEKPLAKLL